MEEIPVHFQTKLGVRCYAHAWRLRTQKREDVTCKTCLQELRNESLVRVGKLVRSANGWIRQS